MAALSRAGITDAFPIQAATIADALAGRDVLGKARTGSGKTLAFGLPAIARLAEEGRATPGRPMAIVLVPTRELAMQVNDALESYAHALGVSIRLVAGGLSMSKQVQALERGVHLVVATPGRLADLTRRGHADLSNVSITVLDEADHMAQMGFMDEITEILAETPLEGQRLLFSATLDGDVEKLISRWMHSPVEHDVTGGDEPARMEHIALNVPPHIKYQLATRIANRQGRTIAFVRTKLAADRVADQMREAGVLAVALHGDKPQNERTAAITGFRAGNIPVLVATDVAARGIHVDHVDLVLQIDPPTDSKDYTHRAGRTARAGADGLIVTIVLPHQRKSTDRMFEGAGIDPLFRKVRGDDAESLELVDKLTGASEPSGFRVEAPAVKVDERDWRANRDAGRRSARIAHNGAGKRAPRGMKPERGGRPAGGDSRASSARADELSKREAELIARERALSEREGALSERESDVQRRAAAPRRESAPRTQDGKRDWKPRGENSSAKPYRDRSPRPDSGGRPERDAKPFGKSTGGRTTGGKPYGKPDRDGKPYGKPDRDAKPYGKPDRDGKPYGKPDRDAKPYGKPDRDGKPAYGKSQGSRPTAGGKPATGSKQYGKPDRDAQPHGTDDRGSKPYAKPSRDGKPAGQRGGKPPQGGKPYKPAKPRKPRKP